MYSGLLAWILKGAIVSSSIDRSNASIKLKGEQNRFCESDWLSKYPDCMSLAEGISTTSS